MNLLRQHIAFLCCLFLVCPSSYSQEEEVVTEARYDRILVKVSVEDASIESRRRAIESAHGEAVSLWLISVLGEVGAEVESYFRGRIEHYILTADVVRESEKAYGGEFEVEVYLNSDLLRFDVASLLFPKRVVRSSVLILMGQSFVDNAYLVRMDTVGGGMLEKLLSDTKFSVMSQEEIDGVLSLDEVMSTLQGGAKKAAQIGRAIRRDIVVLGEVRTGEVEEEGSHGKVKAFADVMIVRSSDGYLLDRLRAEAIVSGDDPVAISSIAARDAVFKIQQRVLVAAALGVLTQGDEVWTHCVVRGWDIKRITYDVVDYLESKEVVESVNVLRSDRDSLVLDLAYSGKTSGLIAALGEYADEPYWLEAVRVVDGGEMVFELHVRE